MELDGKQVQVLGRADGSVPVVYLPAVTSDAAGLKDACRAAGCPDFSLVVVSGLAWDEELSPWPAPAAVSKSDRFTGGGPGFVRWLVERCIPAVEEAPAPVRAIAGYSMAGLLAAYAPFATDVFDGLASASGSLWFPGFLDFARTTPLARVPKAAFFSVGKKESRTRNPLVSQVGARTRELAAWYGEQGAASVFEENPGGHFHEPAARMGRGVAWVLGQLAR